MDLCIKYIGNDTKYWSKLKQKFASDYSHFNLHFLTEHVDESFNPRKCFVTTYQENPNIVYVDFSIEEKKCLYFCKLFNRNNVTRLKSLVALHEFRKGWINVDKAVLASVRINHFKSSEVLDAVYDPVSLLNVELAKDPEFAYGKELGTFHLKQVLRVAYIEDDCFHVETNSPLPFNEIIEVDNHPIEHLMSSKRFYTKTFSDTNLYYNTRFAYDLEFAYHDDHFFQVTEESWLLYKKFNDNPLGYKEETGKRYEDLLDDVKKRKKKIRPLRASIREWTSLNADSVRAKKVKVMVIDDTMEIFSQIDDPELEFPYALNIQNCFTSNHYQVKRSKPHFIAVHFDAINNKEEIGSLLQDIKSLPHYEPYILVFNFYDGCLKNEFKYDHILTFKGNVHIDTIKSMAQKLDEKLHLSETKDRVYFETSTKGAIINFTREVEVIAMTESIIYFKSKLDIPMWTTFYMKEPTKMLVTVIPHKDSGQFKAIQNCYRAMINGLGEKEKQILRIAVNKSLNTDYD